MTGMPVMEAFMDLEKLQLLAQISGIDLCEPLDNVTQSESDLLLDHLFGLIESPEFCVRLRWEVGTRAIWDNRCTSHYAVADDYPQLRRMQRASVCGEKPQYCASLSRKGPR